MPTYEVPQATGAQTQILYGKEADWGVSPATGYRKLNVVGGESLDDAVSTYESQTIRSDRMRNPTVRGTRRPGGSLPIEIAPKGISPFLWHLLGSDPLVTVGTGANGVPAGFHKHVIKGHTRLPVGFTLEKGFLDLAVPQFFALKGCRVARFSMNANVDQIVSASLDLMGREMTLSDTSVESATAADAPVVSPFTSIQAGIYKDNVKISVCQNLALNIDNGMQDSSFVLGSVFRQNLKPGTRRVDGNATFLFQDTEFYNAALTGTHLALKILCEDALGNSIEFLMPQVQLLPNNSSPKIASDGPLTLPANFEALPDEGIGSDIQVTIISEDAAIND